MTGPGAVLALVAPSLQIRAVLEAPSHVQAAVAILLVGVAGALIIWHDEGVVDRSIDSSVSHPLQAMVYGVAAHLVIVFGGLFIAQFVAQFDMAGAQAGRIGMLTGLLALGALGFTVVGAAAMGLRGERNHWFGLGVGALVAGGAIILGWPAGAIVWVVVVSMGAGGFFRKWVHASFD